jgi:hypothetical protein
MITPMTAFLLRLIDRLVPDTYAPEAAESTGIVPERPTTSRSDTTQRHEPSPNQR